MNTLTDIAMLPEQIAKVQRQMLMINRQIRMASRKKAEAVAAIKVQVLHDPELKTDKKRDTQEKVLMTQDENYLAAVDRLQSFSDQYVELEIEVEMLRSQLSLAKLGLRRDIAEQMAAAA